MNTRPRMWVQLDFLQRTGSASVQLPGTPPAAYIECYSSNHANAFAKPRGWGENPTYVGFPTLEEVVLWLYKHEYKREFEGMDAWLAQELERGCVFVPFDEAVKVRE